MLCLTATIIASNPVPGSLVPVSLYADLAGPASSTTSTTIAAAALVDNVGPTGVPFSYAAYPAPVRTSGSWTIFLQFAWNVTIAAPHACTGRILVEVLVNGAPVIEFPDLAARSLAGVTTWNEFAAVTLPNTDYSPGDVLTLRFSLDVVAASATPGDTVTVTVSNDPNTIGDQIIVGIVTGLPADSADSIWPAPLPASDLPIAALTGDGSGGVVTQVNAVGTFGGVHNFEEWTLPAGITVSSSATDPVIVVRATRRITVAGALLANNVVSLSPTLGTSIAFMPAMGSTPLGGPGTGGGGGDSGVTNGTDGNAPSAIVAGTRGSYGYLPPTAGSAGTAGTHGSPGNPGVPGTQGSPGALIAATLTSFRQYPGGFGSMMIGGFQGNQGANGTDGGTGANVAAGGGAPGLGGAGGTVGFGGGGIILIAPEIIIEATAVITSNGGPGGAGVAGGNGGDGAGASADGGGGGGGGGQGGGGGCGGYVLTCGQTVTIAGGATVTASGGAGGGGSLPGNGGNGDGVGTAGGSGSNGPPGASGSSGIVETILLAPA